MRKWGEMHPALRAVLVGVVAFAAIVAAGLILGGDLDDAVANAVFYALMIGGGVFFLTRFPTDTAKLDEPGRFIIFLRFPDSSPGSLSSIWQVGVASPSPGRIDFQPTVHDQLIPTGRSKAFTGLRAMKSLPRKANRHDNKQEVPLDFQVITLNSDGGVIEIAATPATLQNLQRVVSTPS
ncbi:hypothetical protein FBY30_3298 [Arthrobacter sp. SLBN-83]|uniref:hypothetical protein n=1 Tax=Arthrobacter sp. SLBN-83 TaxID=2768449 RepID=UPI0011519BF3|nr:hypothetical protein [Arthrobacter sp. SLBN-83]TQJ61011.1 hypothetical protein FBY30_3298 [Arthrobacter sp. SLBN-83]